MDGITVILLDFRIGEVTGDKVARDIKAHRHSGRFVFLLDVGEPAINPAPRAMMRDALLGAAAERSAGTGCYRSRSRSRRAPARRKDMNAGSAFSAASRSSARPALWCPYSCASWIHSIHRGIDVARAAGFDPHRGRDRRDLGARRPTAVQASRSCPDRYGRFRRRHVEISALHPVERSRSPAALPSWRSSPPAISICIWHEAGSILPRFCEILGELGADAEIAEKARSRDGRRGDSRHRGRQRRGDGWRGRTRAREVTLATLCGKTAVESPRRSRRRLLARVGAMTASGY